MACPRHGVAHTGKLARAIVLDLCLLDATGDEGFWLRAVERAGYVASRLAPDPEHGGFVYLPGRFDPRNCSNSVIDSGECTDALARLLLHPRAAGLPAAERERLAEAVERNAETYLRTAVVEKEITNQRLWGAMGLASAYRLTPRPAWREALAQSVAHSLDEQRADGSWGYQPDAARHGAFPGAADLTVYYHGRCLAFLLHVLEAVPDLPGRERTDDALRRGLAFLDAVTLPDGLKPLMLEGKRWFWDGTYEAGSNAYDVYALLRGAARFGEPAWHATALRAWHQLQRHQQPDGSIRACLEPGNADFVCPDFHTADLAWAVQVMGELPPGSAAAVTDGSRDRAGAVTRGGWPPAAPAAAEPSREPATAGDPEPPPDRGVRYFADAGVARLDGGRRATVVRTATLGRNSQWGGAAGGGALVGLTPADAGPGAAAIDGFTVYASAPLSLGGLRRYLRDNPPGREGRQWLFVARLLFAERRPVAALRRLWRGYVWPGLVAVLNVAAPRWAAEGSVTIDGAAVRVEGTPSARDGTVPPWCGGVAHQRTVAVTGSAEVGGPAAGRPVEGDAAPAGDAPYLSFPVAQLEIDDVLERRGAGTRLARVTYGLPPGTQGLRVEADVPLRRRGHLIDAQPRDRAFRLRVSYTI